MTTTEIADRLATAIARSGTGSSDFDLNPETILPAGRKLRPAGVLVPVTTYTDTPSVILTKRASHLKHHPGQIAFPGGKMDPDDATVTDSALREANEEIGLPASQAKVLGTLPPHETVTGFTVTPVIALVDMPFEVIPEPGEVDEVFLVPLDHVTEPANFLIESRRWRGARRRYFTVPYGPYYIWGATARILRALADRMGS